MLADQEKVMGSSDCHRDLIAAARAQAESVPAGSSAATSPSRDWLSPRDSRLDNYRLVRELHRGSQGVVYLAEQQSPHREVAVKMVRRGPLASLDELGRFQREIELLGSLNHPNVVSIHDSGSAAGGLFYVMDFVDGPPLDEYIRQRKERFAPGGSRREIRKTQRDTLALFAKVCDAMQAAHLRGIIHRDLKPGNIRVDAAGEPRVLDFGLAKISSQFSVVSCQPQNGAAARATDDRQLTNDKCYTETGQFLGTLSYASPEQVGGPAGELDVRTDVYSLGVILYQLLTGQPPYTVTGKLSDVVDAIQNRAPLQPSAIAPELRGDLEVILLTSLHKQRERRYQTAGALAEDIRHYLAGEPIDAKRDSRWYVLRKMMGRHRAAVTTTAAILLALVLGVIGTSTGLVRALAAESEARRRADSLAEMVAFLESHLADMDLALLYARGALRTRDWTLPQLREAVEQRRRMLGPASRNTLSLMVLLGNRLLHAGQVQEAEQLLRLALSDGAALAEDDPIVINLLAGLGQALRKLDRMDEAAALGAESVRRARALDSGQTSLAGNLWYVLVRYGATLTDMRRFKEAEAILLEAHSDRQSVLGKGAPVGAPGRYLIRLYDAWHTAEPDSGHDAAAAEWRSKARRKLGEKPDAETGGSP